jgi:5'(3')-deoxyribonucleotidase
MIVAVDLDGVLYEFDKTARYMLRLNYPQFAEALSIETMHWDYIKSVVSEYAWNWLWTEGVKEGLFRYGHVVKDGIVGVNLLAENHEVHIVTHRPKHAVRDTLKWLVFTEIPISGLHILSDEEEKTTVSFDLLVDDKASNISAALAAGRLACLFERAWNQGHYTLPSAKGWLGPRGVVDFVTRSVKDIYV